MKCSRPGCDRAAGKDLALALCRSHHDQRQRRRAEKEGWTQLGLVPAGEVAKHIEALRAVGIGWQRISGMADVRERHLQSIVARQKWVYPGTAVRILAVPITAHAVQMDGSDVSNVGSVRRLRALQTMGYTHDMLAEHSGLCSHTINRIIMEKKFQVKAATARTVEELFSRLQLVPPPETVAIKRARLRAQRRGWAPPFAWDEDTIDDPNAEPDLGKNSKTDWLEDYEELKAMGLDFDVIAARLGTNRVALQQRLRRVA